MSVSSPTAIPRPITPKATDSRNVGRYATPFGSPFGSPIEMGALEASLTTEGPSLAKAGINLASSLRQSLPAPLNDSPFAAYAGTLETWLSAPRLGVEVTEKLQQPASPPSVTDSPRSTLLDKLVHAESLTVADRLHGGQEPAPLGLMAAIERFESNQLAALERKFSAEANQAPSWNSAP